MKKLFIILVVIIIPTLFCACSIGTDTNSTIKYKRKFEAYIQSGKEKTSNVIDLSEGPKLKYDAKLGPNDLNFDFKIVNPY